MKLPRLRVWQSVYREALSLLRTTAPHRRRKSRRRQCAARNGRPLYHTPGIEFLELRQSASVISSFDAVSHTLFITGTGGDSISVSSYAAPYASSVEKIVIQTGDGQNQVSLDLNGTYYPQLREVDLIDASSSGGYDGYGGSYDGYGGYMNELDLYANLSANIFAASNNGVINFYGSDGIDNFDAADGVLNVLHGGTGNETLYGGSGMNLLVDGGGTNWLFGGSGDNVITGSTGRNILVAGPGNNTLYGGTGIDTLYGMGGASNVLYGGPGDETLNGGLGTNVMYGGSSSNLLVDGGGHNTLYNSGTLADPSGISISGSGSAYYVANYATGPKTLTVNTSLSGTVTLTSDNNTFIGGPGPISSGSVGHISLVKAGAGSQTITGPMIYDGATSVTAGTLVLAAGSRLGTTAISVSGGATLAPHAGTTPIVAGNPATGSLGATLTLAAGSTFDMTDGTTGAFQLNQQTNFGGTSLSINGATLSFDVSSGGADQLATAGGASVSGVNFINVAAVGAGLTPNSTYTLLSAASGLGGNFVFADGANNESLTVGSSSYNLTLSNSDTAETLTIGDAQPLASSPVSGSPPGLATYSLSDGSIVPTGTPFSPSFSGDTYTATYTDPTTTTGTWTDGQGYQNNLVPLQF